jgi:16S rRNA (uracil1498-N3)-methyltransferase
MRLTRIYVEAALSPGLVVELPPDAALHVAKVLRARAGDPLILFNGDGREFSASVETAAGSRVRATVAQPQSVDRESPLAATLVQSVPRGDRMDFIVQKATELGVARIVPVLSQRSVVRLDERQAESKSAHWRGIAIGACEQCGRNRLPAVDRPRALLNFLGEPSAADTRLVLDPEAPPYGATAGLAAAAGLDAAAGQGQGAAAGQRAATELGAAVTIAVGPEGGFTADELEAFRVAGYRGIRLGPRILRSETAAIAALTWLQVRYGDL